MYIIHQLTPDTVSAYIDLLASSGGLPPERLEAIRTRLADKAYRANRVVAVGDDGLAAGAMTIEALGEGSFQLHRPLWRDSVPPDGETFRAMIAAVCDRIRDLDGTSILFRPLDGQAPEQYSQILKEAGFQLRGRRVEFKTPLAELPAEEPGRLAWRTMRETGALLAADMLLRSSAGDPNSAPDEDPHEAIREFLGTIGLTDSPDCVQIGFLHDRPVAFLCAQVEPATGWSRIAYMGVLPEARGQGLGREVHLHGMAMLRALGGTLYHGGTAADNTPMLALFRSNGCIESSRMQDWEWKA